MKKRIFTWLYLAVFLAVLLLPGLGMLIVGETRPAANEILASRPKLVNAGGGFNTAVLSDFSDYISDRFAFRQSFVTAWAWLNANVLGTSVEEQVVLGKGGWLYYSETLDDYMGHGLTDSELRAAARNVLLMQEYVKSLGAGFLFTIAPNKNSLYPENMPDYVPADRAASNAARLPEYLAEEGVNCADLFSPFLERDEVLYYRTDSHWTEKGAALAADTLLGALGRDTSYFSADFSTPYPHIGDLYEMLYPAGKRAEEDFSIAPGGYEAEGNTNGGDAITIRTESDSPGSLLCFRDSFGRALYPYLAREYGSAVFSRQADYDLTRAVEEKADTVLIELVERNIPWLLTRTPVFPAPPRVDFSPDCAMEGETAAVSLTPGSGSMEGFVRLTGALPAGPGQPVYVSVNGAWYEALTTLSSDGSAGFSAYVPAFDVPGSQTAVFCGGLFPVAVE